MTGPLVVVGDCLLDVDLEGSSDRLCPDAPVPVVELARQWVRPGGAALAALLAARAGAPVVLVAAIGSDEAGEVLLGLVTDHLDVVALPLQGQTVTKTRIRAAGVPMLRIDTGDGTAAAGPLPPEAVRAIEGAGAMLVSDYGRRVAAHAVLREVMASRAARVPLVWDPHPRGTPPLTGATLMTPNEVEAALIAGDGSGDERGRRLCGHWRSRAVAVTAGARGASLTEAGVPGTATVAVPRSLRLPPEDSPDTCGAGDRFAAAAAEALRGGVTVRAAVEKAVTAASAYIACGGTVTVSTPRPPRPPVSPRPAGIDAVALARGIRQAGGRVVATGGCFDLLHRGHISLLQHARSLGDVLIVCLNSDASVRRAKGPHRPVVNQDDRARVLAALAVVDAVAVFDEDTPVRLLDRIRPHVWVKGTDYADRSLPEADVVTRHGGQVVLLPTLPGYSTTDLVRSANLTAVAG